MDNKTLSIGETASILMGAGLVKLDDLTIGLTLIAAGVILKLAVAFFQKKGLDVKTPSSLG